MEKVGFGGGCHWCTEAVFQSLIGVSKVKQGFIAPKSRIQAYSEAVVVYYDENLITLKNLIVIHLYTHKSTKNQSMRSKYRSAVYVFNETAQNNAASIMDKVQLQFQEQLITQVLPFGDFRLSDERFHNYYHSNPTKPFCETYISPKLARLKKHFFKYYLEQLPND